MMKQRKFQWVGWAVLLILFSANSVYAGTLTFQANVDKTDMAFEESVVLSFVISGDNMVTALKPQMPDLKQDFDVLRGPNQSSSISIINGRYTSSISYQYVLSPKRTGQLEIGAGTLKYEGKTYITEPILINVTQGASSAHTPSGPPSPDGIPSQQQGRQPEIFLRAEVDKETAYIGEQITLSFYLYTQINISGYDINQQPNFSGFWVEELPSPSPPKLQYVTLNDQQYGVALMKKAALFPTASGEVTIDPMMMTLAVKSRSASRSNDPFQRLFDDPFFGRTQEILRKTQPLTLTILPLPDENRPAAFNGDVGNFSMSVKLEPQEVKQDEPVTLTVKIQGSGNVKTLKEPLLTLPSGIKRYDTQITENPFTLQEPIQGEKTFETVLIPSEDGTFQIDPVQFAYFDPQRKTYQTLRSQSLELNVLAKAQTDAPMERRITTKEEVIMLGRDIRFIKTNIPRLSDQGRSWSQSGLFAALHFLSIVALLAACAYKHYHTTYMSNAQYVRRKRANRVSQQRLKSAYDLMRRQQSKTFYAEISGILRHYLADKLNRSAAGITGEISGTLREYGVADEIAASVKTCLEQCDYARFAPIEASREDMRTIIEQVATIIERIEQTKNMGAGRAASRALSLSWLLLPLLGLLVACPAFCATPSPDDLLRQGNALYEQENYEEAIACYQEIIASGLEHGAVYYNLGNAFLKTERLGEAVLQYERAKRLLPRDEDVTFNLNYAKALTLDREEPNADGRLLGLLRRIRGYFTPYEVGAFMLSSFLAVCVLTGVGLFSSKQWRLRLIYLGIAPLLVWICSGALFLAVVSAYASTDAAIVLAAHVEAKNGPGASYSTLFEIHEGAKVRIQREKLDWMEIQLSNKVIGWVMTRDVERIHPSK